jgi:D-aminoacyl-tRNA deacylase
MRVVVQRVKRASVTVDGAVVGSIGHGMLVLLGVAVGDSAAEIEWMCRKLAGLRIFADEAGMMNRSVTDVGGSILIVSQFTLYGDAHKGFRPSYIQAAPPPVAEPLYERFVQQMRAATAAHGTALATGVFGAMMDVELINNGPVTIWIEREAAAGDRIN